jgi:hypothetical protein
VGERIGYARCSTALQDLTAQREILAELGVADDRIYVDKGLTGTNRARPGLDQALAAVRSGDEFVVPKLDRLARSVPDAHDIGDSLVARGVKLSLGGTIYDPADPMGIKESLITNSSNAVGGHCPAHAVTDRHHGSGQKVPSFSSRYLRSKAADSSKTMCRPAS